VAAILAIDDDLQLNFSIFDAAPQESRGKGDEAPPCKEPQSEYFL